MAVTGYGTGTGSGFRLPSEYFHGGSEVICVQRTGGGGQPAVTSHNGRLPLPGECISVIPDPVAGTHCEPYAFTVQVRVHDDTFESRLRTVIRGVDRGHSPARRHTRRETSIENVMLCW